MKTKMLLLLLLQFSILFSGNRINYFEPRDGSKMVNIENNIIIGFERALSITPVEINDCIQVYGSMSRQCSGKIFIIKEKNKVIFIPDEYFKRGEKITVSIKGRLSDKEIKYRFETSSVKPQWYSDISIEKELNTDGYNYENPVINQPTAPIPPLTVTVNNNPENGFIFLANYPYGAVYQTPYLIITNKNGALYFSRPVNTTGVDFKKQPNGILTYFDFVTHKYYALNSSYNLIDSFYTGNGYTTDHHELRVLGNGHAILMSYDMQIVDMSQFVEGGNTSAQVWGLIIQEIDENKNVVFQWRSWDHFQITDAIHENLTSGIIDYVHGNAIEIDNDGNLLLSARHMDEITKINRTNGQIIWRWGGKNNQFTFINDPIHFTYQHAIRRIPSGNVTLFDNGNYHTPNFSRAVEYSLDEVSKTATLVWQYRRTPDIYSEAMGYVQRLPGGNTLISWGTARPTVTEVTPQGTIAFQMTFPQGVTCYRVSKNDWNGAPTSTGEETPVIPNKFELYQNYPNPFNPVTKISFDLPQAEFTELAIYDVTGRLVQMLESGKLTPGKYTVPFDGSNYSSGLYFYRLTAGNFASTQKMILVK